MKRITLIFLICSIVFSFKVHPFINPLKESQNILTINDHQIIQQNNVSQISTKLFAGEVHYSRIPVEYWEHRIQMIKALGLNSLSVYIMWNYHELERGKFDYETGNKNLTLFLQLAKKYDMKVLIRPGPYVCAQWDFGGFPARLLAIEDLVLRANNQKYLDEVKIYFSSLVPILKPYLNNPSNPKGIIVLFQIENQYGFYGSDKSYIQALRKMWSDLGIECEEYYVDAIQNIQKSHWNGANIGINDGITQSQYDFVRTFERKGYLLGGQIYSGWLTHWYENWQEKDINRNQKQYGFLMEYNHSYSMYMVHGGTNFGLTAGANAFVKQLYDYRGHVTSYDYDAPINQQGSAAPKYKPLRQLIKKYVQWTVPQIPDPIPTIKIDKFTLNVTASLNPNIQTASITSSNSLYTFESDKLKMYNQGIVVYETILKKGNYYLKAEVHDFAVVYVDQKYIAYIDRSERVKTDFVAICNNEKCKMRIQVQATGHINFDHQMNTDFKGLISINDTEKRTFEWNMYKVPIDQNIFKWDKSNNEVNSTTLLKAEVNLQKTGDTFLDMSEFNKGYVWVNGHNLGRYWKVGPQKRLFCPGVWMKEGVNTIYVLELLYDQVQKYIQGYQTLK